MNTLILEQLEWDKLLSYLQGYSITEKAKILSQNLKPNFSKEEILKNWDDVLQLKSLIERGKEPPIKYIPLMEDIFKCIKTSPLISGEQSRIIYDLLANLKKLHQFCFENEEQYPLIKLFRIRTYVDNQILNFIDKIVDLDGTLKDTASPTLKNIRASQIALRKKIEHTITQMFLKDVELQKYLQDDFFTIRAERYVIPIKLDGRGRISGSIYDLSASGETLFIEPSAIATLNEQLLDLDLEEKLEITRIFKELTQLLLANINILETNYEEYVKFDFLCAQAKFSIRFKTNAVGISPVPILKLFNARHPMVHTPQGGDAVGNDIWLEDHQKALIVSGPNAGGKTVILKTIGIIHLMLKAALLVPAAEISEVYWFDNIFLEIGDNQNIFESLSSFNAHLLRLKNILLEAKESDLVLLDELGVGTEPQTGAAMAQAILEYLVNKKIFVVTSTHFDLLKTLAFENSLFRNGSMEYLVSSYTPTYKLILDVPGISFGFEVAKKALFPNEIIERAKAIKELSSSSMDDVIQKFLIQYEKLKNLQQQIEQKRLELDSSIDRWNQEREELRKIRENLKLQFANKIQAQMDEFKEEHQKIINELKTEIKKLKDKGKISGHEQIGLYEKAASTKKFLTKISSMIDETIASDINDQNIKYDIKDLHINDEVEVLSIKKRGIITKISDNPKDLIEVQIGALKLNIKLNDIKKLAIKSDALDKKKTNPSSQLNKDNNKIKDIPTPVVIRTSTNSIDLRGYTIDEALRVLWQFIDNAILRGESALIIIHGHGTDSLKKAIRYALSKEQNYNLKYRPGFTEEGGDGVTIVDLVS